jgi:4-diphosphocytidyl-2-C-methyl-D-erythritol kinase
MVVFPKAKINLGLMITGKRPDGYHDIETIFYPVGLCDAMEVVEDSSGLQLDLLTVTGNMLPGNPEENLVIRAVRKLRERHSFPFLKIHLHKIIPPGAGLGGGSSDAACMIRTINKTFKISLGTDEMKDVVSGLGSDCPFFIDNLPALKPFFNGLHVMILNPGILISTHEAYENCEPSSPEIHLTDMISRPITEWRELIINDFEKTIFQKYPQIKNIKQALYNAGAIYSSMSGSGSSVYGIFLQKPVVPADLKKYAIYNGEL